MRTTLRTPRFQRSPAATINGWVQLTAFHFNTRNQFDPEGRNRPYFAEGHLITTSLIPTAVVGIARGADAWVQIPVHTLSFEEASGDSRVDRAG